MQVTDQAMRVCIYLQTTDRYQGRSLYQAVVSRAKALGIARISVTKGYMGYGSSGKWHVQRTWRLIQDVPVMIEALDQEPRLRQLLHCLDDMCSDGLVTIQQISTADLRKTAPTTVPIGRSLSSIIKQLLGYFKWRLCIIYIPASIDGGKFVTENRALIRWD